jgi:AcrR family transcriptional regulator
LPCRNSVKPKQLHSEVWVQLHSAIQGCGNKIGVAGYSAHHAVCETTVYGKYMNRGEFTKQKIIDAALHLFIQKGYHGTSINDITAKVGITKGSLYFHFKSKKDLVLYVFNQFEERYVDAMIASANNISGNATDKINRTITFSSRFGKANRALVTCYHYVASELSEKSEFSSLILRIRRKQMKFYTDLIETGIQQGQFKKDVNAGMAAQIFASGAGSIFQLYVSSDADLNWAAFVKTFRTIFLTGIQETA